MKCNKCVYETDIDPTNIENKIVLAFKITQMIDIKANKLVIISSDENFESMYFLFDIKMDGDELLFKISECCNELLRKVLKGGEKIYRGKEGKKRLQYLFDMGFQCVYSDI